MGGCIFAFLTGAVSLVWSVSPGLLLDWFTSDPRVWEAGRQYLVIVGPAFAFQGIGFTLCVAAQKVATKSCQSQEPFSDFYCCGCGIHRHTLYGFRPQLFVYLPVNRGGRVRIDCNELTVLRWGRLATTDQRGLRTQNRRGKIQ